MEAIQASGRARLLGVSNVTLEQLDSLCREARVRPRFVQNRCYAAQVWVTTPEGGALEPGILRGVEDLARDIETDPRVGSVLGPTTLLRWLAYVSGGGDRLPDDPAAWPGLFASCQGVEQPGDVRHRRDRVDEAQPHEAFPAPGARLHE